MRQPYYTETTVAEDGTVRLDGVPFPPGEAVDVIVLPRRREPRRDFPLRGSVVRYDDPTEPVAESDWQLLR